MSFAGQRAALAGELARLESLIRQAQEISRALEERAVAAEEQTESFADDTTVARVLAAARRARQELGALARMVHGAADGLGG